MAEQKKKLTPEEKKKVQAQIKTLQESIDDEEEGEGTPADVEEQKKKLAALFDRLGLTEEDYDLLVGAMATGTEERTRAIVREELAAEEEGQGGGSLGQLGQGDQGGQGGQGGGEGGTSDEPPGSKHWTEKKLFGKKDEEVPPSA